MSTLIARAREAHWFDDEYYDEEDPEPEPEPEDDAEQNIYVTSSDNQPLTEDVILDGSSIKEMINGSMKELAAAGG